MWCWVIPFLVGLLSAGLTYWFCQQRCRSLYKDKFERLELDNKRLSANLRNSKETAEELRAELVRLKDAGVSVAVDEALEVNTSGKPELVEHGPSVRVADAVSSAKTIDKPNSEKVVQVQQDSKRVNTVPADSTAVDTSKTNTDKFSTNQASTKEVAVVDNMVNDAAQPQPLMTTHDASGADVVTNVADATNTAVQVATLKTKTDDTVGETLAKTTVSNPKTDSAKPASTKSASTSSQKPSKSAGTKKTTKADNDFDAKTARDTMGKRIKKDDLRVVEGIGPKISDLFCDAGIDTWQKLADSSVEACQKVLDNGGGRYSVHNPQTWPEQASLAAKGTWAELKALQDKLKGGRRV